uniref:Cytoplasmic tRNA 2-thiolation protein 2 n=1 Tax=Pogona vitticeps TaxID=103695 RepID=A0ABM5EUI0_9SAUR
MSQECAGSRLFAESLPRRRRRRRMCEAEPGGCGGGGRGSPPLRAPRSSHPLKCMKCKEGSPVLIIRVGDAFCKACFKEYFVHKFRAMLGKNRCIYPGEKGLSQRAAKKLRFKPGIIYVDEGAVCGQSLSQREEIRTEVETILQATGFLYHVVSLEEVFSLPSSVLRSLPTGISAQDQSYKDAVDDFIKQQQEKVEDNPGSVEDQLGELSLQDCPKKEGDVISGTWPPPDSHTETLTRLFGAVKSLTAKEELLQTLRNHLILHVARTRGYVKVMMGDSCTRVAVKLLTNLCLGRGAFLATDTGFSDSRHGDVLFLRPMREYPAKEIVFYNHLFGVPTVFTPALDTKASERASIHRLIENFLAKLQSEFPSTVSTVYRRLLTRCPLWLVLRTGEKLCVSPQEAAPNGPEGPARCLFCLCALDTNVVDGSSLQAALFSEQLGQRPPPLPDGNGCCRGGAWSQTGCGGRPPAGGDTHPGRAELLPLLCYSCRLTVKDMRCLEWLPSYISLEAERRRCRSAMKREIQEFLLEEDHEPTA